MRPKSAVILGLVLAATCVLAVAPARADRDDWHHEHHDGWHHRWHGDRDGWRHGWRRDGWGVVVAPAPRAYYRPPPAYYAPPPVYYAPPPPPVY